MGYYLQAFICRQSDKSLLKKKFYKAVSVDLGQGLALIPMTEELFDEINTGSSSTTVDKFEYMTENVEKMILGAIGDRKFAYVEAEYFGGKGGQMAIIWNKLQKRATIVIWTKQNQSSTKRFQRDRKSRARRISNAWIWASAEYETLD